MDKEEVLSDLETVIFVTPTDVESSKPWINGCLNDTATKILSADKKKQSYVLTGQCNCLGNAESDGPIGAAVLCYTLRLLGYNTYIMTDSYCASVVLSAANNCPVSIYDNANEVSRDLSFIISVGRPSRLVESRSYKFVDGDDVTNAIIPLDLLFESHLRPLEKNEYFTVGICDRYEEIGAGNLLNIIPEKDIAAAVCNSLILAGTSNWGAIALAAALVILAGDKEIANKFIEYNSKQEEMLTAMINYGAYDSKTGEHLPIIDGMLFHNEHESVNYSIIALIKKFFEIE